MRRFHFELVEGGVIASSHYGLELHEIAVDDLDSAVDLAHLLARRAAEQISGPVTVVISDESKHPFARITLDPRTVHSDAGTPRAAAAAGCVRQVAALP